MDDEEVPKLSYEQLERLSDEGKKYTGNHLEHWVDSKSICTTCRSGHIIRRGSQNRRAIYCNALCKFVPEDIIECNEHSTFTTLSLHQMGQMATLIGGLPERKVGFRKE
jgi:hypothetical protein